MKSAMKLIGCFVSLLFLIPTNANAHAQMTSTFPKSNATVNSVPDQVWIEFDGNLTEIDGAEVNSLEVRDSSGSTISVGKTIVAGARVIANLSKQVHAGLVKVSYRVVSGDGHPVEGGFSFNLNIPDSISTQKAAVVKISKQPTISKKPVGPVDTASTKPKVIEQEIPAVQHSHESFTHRHSVHIYEALVAVAAIVAWFLYERRKRRTSR